MQKIQGLMRKAMDDYNMIQPGDVVAVGISGGKDSVALLFCLAALQRYYPVPFALQAITLDPCFGGTPGDYSAVASLCRDLGVPYTVKETNIGHIVFEARDEKYPCSLCARLRRGTLHKTAKELGCNKLALGHHRDDVAETFYMNLLDQGALGCFAPVTYLSEADLTMIRPMIYVPERDIRAAVARQGLPVLASSCPVDGKTEREHMKQLLASLQQRYPALPQNVISILQENGISHWKKQNS